MANKKQALVILSPGFPADEADTTCLPAQQVFVRALRKNYPLLNIVVIAFQYPFKAGTYTWQGETIISLNGQNKSRLHRLTVWYKALRALKQLHKQYTITGLLSFWVSECAVVGKYFAHRHNLKHMAWILGQDAKKNNPFIKLIKPKPGEIIAMSQFVARQFYANYRVQPVAVIPNGIDVDMFGNETVERSIDIFGAGSLIPLKQYDVFISVLRLICNVRPATKALLCGKGPELAQLQALIVQHNLTRNIVLAGEKPHKEILALMQQSKVFLHPSNYEGFSTVCLEALYAGAHVISFVKPMDAAIEHWYIVDSTELMAAKALALLADPSTQYFPVLPYSMDEVARQVMALYGVGVVNE